MAITGFTAGAFDLCHVGHMMMFNECKKNCDYLIVALHVNPNNEREEKNVPIMSLFERWIILKSITYIDEIIPYETEEDLFYLLNEIKPDIRFMGADWENKPNYSRDKLPNMKVIYNSRNHNFSSSELRKRIYEAEK